MREKKGRFFLLFCLISSAFVFAAIRADSFVKESNDYIEVCANGIVHVPLDTQFVKCRGIVRKVMGFTYSLPKDGIDCQCPKCCDGLCYIIIDGDPEPELEIDTLTNSPDGSYGVNKAENSGGIVYIWISC